jgi:hypothetical protein
MICDTRQCSFRSLEDQLCRVTVEMPTDKTTKPEVFKVSEAVPRPLNEFKFIVNADYEQPIFWRDIAAPRL